MLSSLLSLVLAAASVQVSAQNVKDVWLTDSVYPVAVERLDPIVNPNAVSQHTHRIFGASNFGASFNYETYTASSCTSIGPQADKSAYWLPQLYWMDKDNSGNPTYAAINGNVRIYYNLWRDVDSVPIRPFPPGLRMLVGSPNSKAPPANLDHVYVCQTGTDFSKNINGNDFNFNSTCVQGLKAQLNFPPCWDGINLYKPDQSHMAYTGAGRSFGGSCPTTHPFRLPGIQLEIIFKPSNVALAKGKNMAGHLIWANGDTTGFGWHGDFVNGWDFDVLQAALNNPACVRAGQSGSTASAPMAMSLCPPLGATQDDAKAQACTVAQGLGTQKEDVSLTDLVQIPRLPGCNLPWGYTGSKPTCNGTTFTPDVTPFKGTDGPLVAPAKWQLNNALPTTGGWTNLWCVAGSATVLTNQVVLNDNSLSATRCRDNCFASGYRYAAMTPDVKCMCGTGIPAGSQNKLGECTSKCAGNSTEFCGAGSRSSIWYAPVSMALPSGVSRGCYIPPYSENNGFKGAILYTVSAAVTTPQSCINTCSSRGYKWAATQNGDTCNCGNTWQVGGGSFTAANQNWCTTKCSGDTSQICGQVGTYQMMIYDLTKGTTIGSGGVSSAIPSTSGASSKPATTAAATAIVTASTKTGSAAPAASSSAGPDADYMGCWTSPSADALRNYTFTNSGMTQSMCFSACASMKYAFAGLQNGNACMCGDENFSTYQQLDSSCNKACGGSSSTTCGSAFNMAIYSVTDLHGDPASDPAGYVGCYVDAGHNGGGAPLRIKPAGLTIDMCVGGCKELNYTVASMTQGNLCHCSNKWGGGSKLPDNQCTTACVGDSKQICGSANNAVLYDTTIGPKAPVKPAGWLGCWAGQPTSTFSYTTGDMSSDVCRTTCKVRGYSLASMQNGNACRCGNSNASSSRNPSYMCTIPCTGTKNETCGGSGFSDLWDATTVAAPTSTVAGYLGCYGDVSTFNAGGVSSDYMNNQICAARCLQLGASFSGVQDANCKCSKTKPVLKAAESSCTYKCSGDSKQACGGYSWITAYDAKIAATAIASDTSGIPKSNVTYPGYLGCWNENNGALILPATVLQTNTMTIDQCIATCKAGNYKYAGLQSGKRCYCDNAITGSDWRVRDAWCKTPCPGNANQICGSDGKMSVFDVAQAGSGSGSTSKSSSSIKPSSSTAKPSSSPVKPSSSSIKPTTTSVKPTTTTAKPTTTTAKTSSTAVKNTAAAAKAMFVSGGSIKSSDYDSYDEDEADASTDTDAKADAVPDYASEYAMAFGNQANGPVSSSGSGSSTTSGSVVKPADVMVAQGGSGKAPETVIRYVTVTAGVSEPTKRSHSHRRRGIASRSRAGLRGLRT